MVLIWRNWRIWLSLVILHYGLNLRISTHVVSLVYRHFPTHEWARERMGVRCTVARYQAKSPNPLWLKMPSFGYVLKGSVLETTFLTTNCVLWLRYLPFNGERLTQSVVKYVLKAVEYFNFQKNAVPKIFDVERWDCAHCKERNQYYLIEQKTFIFVVLFHK